MIAREATIAFEQVQIITVPTIHLLRITTSLSQFTRSYAALRTPYNAESPSLNPGGALAMLSWQPGHQNEAPGKTIW
jgi:hypothetical protein